MIKGRRAPKPALVWPMDDGPRQERTRSRWTPRHSTPLVKEPPRKSLRRHEQATCHALHHKSVTVPHRALEDRRHPGTWWADEDDPQRAPERATMRSANLSAQVRVSAGFKLNGSTASAWIDNEYRKPR